MEKTVIKIAFSKSAEEGTPIDSAQDRLLVPFLSLQFEVVNKSPDSCQGYIISAEEGTRTPTPLRAHVPETCVSTNFTTTASGEQR